MKTISIRQMSQIKKTAQNVAADVLKKEKLAEKIAKLGAEYKTVSEKIEGWQAPIRLMSDGLTTEDLVVRVVAPYLNEDGTQKMDKDGHPLTTTKYVPNEDVVMFDEEKRVYVIKEAEATAEAQTEVETPATEENNLPFGI